MASIVGLSCRESACNAEATGDAGLIPGLERFPWRRKWPPTPVFLPGKFHGQNRGLSTSCWARVHGVAKSQLRLRNWADIHRALSDTDARRQRAEKARSQDMTRGTLLRRLAVKRREIFCSIMPVGDSQVVLAIRNSPANARDVRDAGSIPGSGRFPGGGDGNPLQYSCLENPMDRRAWRATVHKVTESQTRLKWHSTQGSTLCQGQCNKQHHLAETG